MPLAAWSSRRIRRLWIVGGAVELLLVLAVAVPAVVQSVRVRSEEAKLAKEAPPPPTDYRALYERYRLSNPGASLAALPSGDTLIVLPSGADTISLTFRNGYLRGVAASKQLRQDASTLVSAAGRMTNAALSGLIIRALIIAGVVYLTIPIALTAVTVVWRVKRKAIAHDSSGDHSA